MKTNKKRFIFRKKTAAKDKHEKEKLRILVVDGGGIKGYFVTYLVHRLKVEHGINLKDHFDLFVGTSVGAISTMAILNDVDLEPILPLFVDAEESFFGKKYDVFRRLQRPLLAKYDSKTFEKFVRKIVHDKKVSEMKVPGKHWAIFSTNLSEAKPVIFGSDTLNGVDKKYRDLKISDVMLASSAAPGYFPPKNNRLLNGEMADGGLWANTPTLQALFLGLKSFNLTIKDIVMLNIGTTDLTNKEFVFKVPAHKRNIVRDNVNNAAELVRSIMYTSQNFSVEAAEEFLGDNFMRIAPVNETREIVEENLIDRVSEAFLENCVLSYETQKDQILEFLKHKAPKDHKNEGKKV